MLGYFEGIGAEVGRELWACRGRKGVALSFCWLRTKWERIQVKSGEDVEGC